MKTSTIRSKMFFKSLILWKSLIVLCFFFNTIHSQDLGAIGKDKKPVKVTGSATASQILYEAIGIKNRRPGYNYFLSGNLNISLYGWQVPLSYTFSNQQSQFQQPFNQFGATPYYKWVKLYAGYSSMNFSSYSLNNHVFLGGGVQLTPGVFRFSAMFGRLQRAIEEDTSNKQVVPFYERLGGGFKAGVGKVGDFVDLIFFMAKDNPNSIRKTILDWDVKPAENVVLSTVFSKALFKSLIISGEYATSAYIKDTRINSEGIETKGVFNAVPGFKANASTSYNNAFKVAAMYTKQTYSLGLVYENIDPGYRTLGSYYFNDDLESVSINGATRFFKNKLSVAGSVGLQRNNLKSEKISNTNRTVWMISVQYSPIARLNLNASYSDFQTFTRIQSQFQRINQLTPYDNLDTLNFTQIAKSINAGGNYVLSNPLKKSKRDILNINFTYQVSGNKNNNPNVVQGTIFINNNINYSHNYTPLNMNFSLGFNTNINELIGHKTYLIGPIGSFSKALFNKQLKLSASLVWTNSLINSIRINEIYNLRLSAGYVFKKKHNFNLSGTSIRRNNFSYEDETPSFTELTLHTGYTFNF